MNNTKKITQGAMLIAIIGALIEIDKLLSSMFSTLIVMMIPIVIIIYSAMYSIKDALVFCVALLITGYIVGAGTPGFTYIVYIPSGIIVGIGYSLVLRKTHERQKLFLTASILYVAVELLAFAIVLPLLGLSVSSQIVEMKEMVNIITESMTEYGLNSESLSLFSSDNFLVTMLVISTILIGIMEGFITNVLSSFLLKKFKIMEIERGTLLSFQLNPIIAYICIGFMFLQYFNFENMPEMLQTIRIILPLLSTMLLAFYGYIFICIYFRITGRQKMLTLVIISIFLLPTIVIYAFAIIGFLYSAGPLKGVLAAKGVQL